MDRSCIQRPILGYYNLEYGNHKKHWQIQATQLFANVPDNSHEMRPGPGRTSAHEILGLGGNSPSVQPVHRPGPQVRTFFSILCFSRLNAKPSAASQTSDAKRNVSVYTFCMFFFFFFLPSAHTGADVADA